MNHHHLKDSYLSISVLYSIYLFRQSIHANSELRQELKSTVTDLKERERKLANWIHRYEADKQQSEHTLAEYKDILARMDESHIAQTMDLKNQVLEVCF